jgi:hypothetical protein
VDTALRMAKQPPVPSSLWAGFDSFANLPNIAGIPAAAGFLNQRPDHARHEQGHA